MQVRVVHGSWKREDPNGIHIEVSLHLSFPSASFAGKVIKQSIGRGEAVSKYQSGQSVHARDVRDASYEGNGPLQA